MGFSACHPAISFLYFACVIASALSIAHPVYLAITYLAAFAYVIYLRRGRGILLGLCLIPCAAAFALWYASYHHFGVTVLAQNFVDNNITLESLAKGLSMGMMAACAILWFSCVHKIMTADKIVCLFGRVSPRLSLFLAILLRMVPRIGAQARKINMARCGVGRGVNQGNIFRRVRNLLAVISMLITWTIEMTMSASTSMQSRGSNLRGRTAFSIYRFDNRDRGFVILLFAEMTVLAMGILLKQTYVRYSPRFILLKPTLLGMVFYLSYALLCLTALMLDVYTDAQFRRARRM